MTVPPMRSSRMGPRRAFVLIAVHVLIALHVAHWMSEGSTLSPLEPSEAMEFSKHKVINAGFVFFGLAILSTLVLGRWFCGWACHLVAIQDLSLWAFGKLGIRPKPFRSRALALVPFVAAFYMFLWPLVYRHWKGIDVGETRVALMETEFWQTFPPLGVAIVTLIVSGVLIVYFLGAKGFCTYACPYGAFFGIFDKLAPWRIRVTDACAGCSHCTATCTSNVRVHEEVRDHGMVVDAGCMKCLDCVSVCPTNALYFGLGKPSIAVKARAAGWKKAAHSLPGEVVLLALFLATFLVFRGLYGRIPFLLALGIAGILAYLLFLLGKLAASKNQSLGKRVLKKGGRLTTGGWTFVGCMGGIIVLTAHSAVIQVQDGRSERAFEATLGLQQRALLRGEPPTDAEAATAEEGLELARFVKRNGLLPTAGNELRLAWFELVAGNESAFEEGMRTVVELHPESGPLHEDLGRFYQVRGRIEDAAAAYEKALEIHPTVGTYDRLAQMLWGSGNVQRAVEVYEGGVATIPESTTLHFNLGIAYGMTGRSDRALEQFEEVVRLDDSRLDAHENLARGHAAQGRFAEAVPHLRRALELEPRGVDNLDLLVRVLLELGERDAALELVRDAGARGVLPPEAVAGYEARIESSSGG